MNHAFEDANMINRRQRARNANRITHVYHGHMSCYGWAWVAVDGCGMGMGTNLNENLGSNVYL